ncbi:MAG: response regulator transcription factor [Sphingobacteriales bacterium]|nr:response regulator transcription factor [Sphingobacteriales bacterium]
MKEKPIRIMLVDDHPLVRASWKLLLENNPRFLVTADCSSGPSALEQLTLAKPEIMLVDINMSPMNGFKVTRSVLEKMPSVKIIGLSVHNQPKYAIRMLQLGARGFLTKTSTLEEINAGILAVHRGEMYICEEVKRNMPPAE